MVQKSISTKIFSKMKHVFDEYMILGNFYHWIRNWIIIDFFRANSFILESLEFCDKKIQCLPLFQLNFHHWTAIFDQKWLSVKNKEFENSSCCNLIKYQGNFKILYCWLNFIFVLKFKFSDKNLVAIMVNIVIFDHRTPIIPK